MRHIKLVLVFLFFAEVSFSQYNNTWYFANGAGLNFNPATPVVLTNGNGNCFDHVSAISDAAGNLLFYTDGMTVWNKLHSPMTNGLGLQGTNTTGQSALIVPVPCSSKYVIFCPTDFANPGFLRYSVVDMSLSAGLGAVVIGQKNISLGTGWTEKLCAYYNPSGNYYWVVTHKWNSDQFVAFKVDATTIATSSVGTSIGSIHNCGSVGGAHDAMGQLTISQDGTKIVNALTCTNAYEVFDFDITTGVLSNSISLTGDGFNPWGTAFSPDSKKIYVNTIFGSKLYQYDLTIYNQAAVAASQYTVYNTATAGYSYGYLELGPNGKIYVTRPNTTFASVINAPDNLGAACAYTHSALNFSPETCLWGLSRIAYNIPGLTIPVTFSVQPPTCNMADGSVTVTPTYSASYTYTWLPSNQTTSVATGLSAGNYTLIISNGCITSSNTISIGNPNTLSITANSTFVCSAPSTVTTVTLSASGVTSYTWEPGTVVSSTIAVSPTVTTTYTVSGTSSTSCIFEETVTVFVNPTPTITVSPSPATVCPGSPVSFTATGATSYTWLPTSITTSVALLTSTINSTYTVNGISNGCSNTQTLSIVMNTVPIISISASSNTRCTSGSPAATLTASGALTFTWNIPPVIILGPTLITFANVTTVYSVTGTNSQGCNSTTSFTVIVLPSPTLVTLASPIMGTICPGTSATVSVYQAATYTWYPPGNITATTVILSPTVATLYTVVGTSTNGCTGTKTLNISIYPSPTININASSTLICSGNGVALGGTGGWGSNSYTWFPGGIITSSLYPYPTTTTIFTLQGSNMQGCIGSETIQIFVDPSPTLVVSPILSTICEGETTYFTVSGAQNYTWYPSAAQGTVISVSPSSNTTYTVIGTNSLGCVSSKSITINVNPKPNITTTVSGLSVICYGASTVLSVNGASSYLWLPDNIIAQSVSVSPLANTIYTIIGTSPFGCKGNAYMMVNVIPLPNIVALSSATTICNSGTVSLTASGASSYTWLPMNQTGIVITAAPMGNTTYTLIGFDGVCTNTTYANVLTHDCSIPAFGLTKAVNTPSVMYDNVYHIVYTITAVNNSNTDLINIALYEDITKAFPAPATFTLLGAPVITSQNSGLLINPLFNATEGLLTDSINSILYGNKRDTIVFELAVDPHGFKGPYKNWIIGFANYLDLIYKSDSSNNGFIWDQNGNGTPFDDSAPTIIELNIPPMFIPEVITPNDDAKNDKFVIKYLEGRNVNLTIFNRWGSKVYEKQNYDNSWDGYPNVNSGQTGSGRLPQATYFYAIEFLDGNKEVVTGYVVIQY